LWLDLRRSDLIKVFTWAPLDLMMKSSLAPLNSVAVSILAVAVIVLAIKEPRCDSAGGLLRVETPTRQKAPPQQPTVSGHQRELRKF